MADFRYQQGIYILYSLDGPYYVGLTRKQGLGKRLKDHLADRHQDKWQQFSWFGFCSVLKGKDDSGLCRLKKLGLFAFGKPQKVIGDIEGLLIRVLAPSKQRQMKFSRAEQWFQVRLDETERYLDKVG